MGKINLGRVVVGGLLAGVVLNLFDFVLNGMVLADDWTAAMAALNKPAMDNSMIAIFVGIDFVAGIALVWLYAAIRPRFGASAKTGVIAGLAGWVFAGLLPTLFQIPTELLPMKLYTWPLCASLVFVPLATVAGAAVYKE